MTTVESFQAVAAIGAAAGALGLLIPARGRTSADARIAGALAVTIASWLLLVGSLVSRSDLDRLTDRLDSPARLGAGAVAVIAGLAVTVVLARLCIRRPVVWLVLVAVALPIRIPVSLGNDRGGNLLLPLYWVIVIGIVAWAWGRTRGTLRDAIDRRSALDIPIAAFTAFSLASIWWSADMQEGTVKAVFFYIPFVILYRLVVNWWPLATRPMRAMVVTTLGMAVAVAVVAVGQFATRTIWWNDTLKQGNVYNRFFRANGIFYAPNILGRYLMLALVVTAAYAVIANRGRRLALLGVLAGVVAAGLIVTFSRSSALGLMVAVTLLAFRAFGWRRTLLVGASALVLIGGPAVALNANVRDKATSLERLASTGEGRLRLVKGGIELWKTAPVTGVGLGAFSQEYRSTVPRKEAARTRVFISHTAPVTTLAELGIIGFALFLVLLSVGTTVLWRGSRRTSDEGGWAQWTIMAILVAIVVHSLLYSALFEDPYVWTLAAIGVALGAAQTAEARQATRTLPAVTAATG